MILRAAVLMGLALALSACGGTDGAGYCVGSFQGGSTSWGCTSCSGVDPLDDEDDFQRAIDNKSGTATSFGLGTGGQITITAKAPAGMSFPAGVDAGALMRFPTGSYASIGMQFNTYRNGVRVDSGKGNASAVGGTVSGAGQDTYYPFTTTGTFDTLEAVVSVSGNNGNVDFRLAELCGDR
jgi:hypothetical protein